MYILHLDCSRSMVKAAENIASGSNHPLYSHSFDRQILTDYTRASTSNHLNLTPKIQQGS